MPKLGLIGEEVGTRASELETLVKSLLRRFFASQGRQYITTKRILARKSVPLVYSVMISFVIMGEGWIQKQRHSKIAQIGILAVFLAPQDEPFSPVCFPLFSIPSSPFPFLYLPSSPSPFLSSSPLPFLSLLSSSCRGWVLYPTSIRYPVYLLVGLFVSNLSICGQQAAYIKYPLLNCIDTLQGAFLAGVPVFL